MSYGLEYNRRREVAAYAGADARTTFIRRTYGHLAVAVLAFIALESLLVNFVINNEVGQQLMAQMFATRISWLLVLGGFMVVGWIANSWAMSSTSRGLQYAGLSLYVVAQSIIFLPMLYIAKVYFGPELIPTAGIITLALFGGLTLGVFLTGRDFSFLGPILWMCGLGAMGLIVASALFTFSLGLVFSFAMVALMCGYILYYTSNVLHHYNTDMYVAASLALFASVATLFWYVLQILMSLQRR